MRIINPNQNEHIGTCSCGAKLAITGADIKFGWFNAYIICPVCKRKVIINSKDLYRFGYMIEE